MAKRLMTAAALVAVALATAQPAMAEPCGAVLCLSNNELAPHECKDHVDGYFSIRVYHTVHRKKVFDPGATAAKRYKEVFDKCDGARQSDKDRINAKFGTLKNSPFQFSDHSTDDNSSYNSDEEANAAYASENKSSGGGGGQTASTPSFGPLPTTKDGLLAEYNALYPAWQSAVQAAQASYNTLVACGQAKGGPNNCPAEQADFSPKSITAQAYWSRVSLLYDTYKAMP